MSSTSRAGGRGLKALIWVENHLEDVDIIERYVQMAVPELKSRGHEAVVCRNVESAVEVVEDADLMTCWRDRARHICARKASSDEPQCVRGPQANDQCLRPDQGVLRLR